MFFGREGKRLLRETRAQPAAAAVECCVRATHLKLLVLRVTSVWAFLPAWAECLHTCEQVPDAHVSKCVVTFWLQGRELGCS